ncbi:hypothetical protein [Gracilimonas mengyeensis]|uniref:Uncharacterized protein n=1 Tax=Gracilimonas mengyeensis TaxID=1302730 RepID=A0A521EBX3_9BACT|nr:hypothetical protein [Gracilimonas mengyeensis]SMO81415.1 hypothetical protein SAMN06265219_11193 [Gracilimonas mengyeensis]
MLQEIEHITNQLLMKFNQFMDELDAHIEARVQHVLDELEQVYEE